MTPANSTQQDQVIRCFYAILFDQNTKNLINKLSKDIQQQLNIPNLHWIIPDKIHLTLRFIGNIKPQQINSLNTSVGAAIEKITPFNIQLSSPELFPSSQQPHIISLPVITNDKLNILAQCIENAFVSCGFKPVQRSFCPHVSLARMKHGNKQQQLLSLDNKAMPKLANSIEIKVDAIHLVQSQTSPAGVRYIPLFTTPL